MLSTRDQLAFTQQVVYDKMY